MMTSMMLQYAELTRLGVELAAKGREKTDTLDFIQHEIEDNFRQIFDLLGIEADIKTATDEEITFAIHNPELAFGEKIKVFTLLQKGAAMQTKFNQVRDELDKILHRLKSIQIMIDIIRAQLCPGEEE